jgi:hypothetical protein
MKKHHIYFAFYGTFLFFYLKMPNSRWENTEVDWYFNDLTNIKAWLFSEEQKNSKSEHTSH